MQADVHVACMARLLIVVNLLSGDMVGMHLLGPLTAIFMLNVSSAAVVGIWRAHSQATRHRGRALEISEGMDEQCRCDLSECQPQ